MRLEVFATTLDIVANSIGSWWSLGEDDGVDCWAPVRFATESDEDEWMLVMRQDADGLDECGLVESADGTAGEAEGGGREERVLGCHSRFEKDEGLAEARVEAAFGPDRLARAADDDQRRARVEPPVPKITEAADLRQGIPPY